MKKLIQDSLIGVFIGIALFAVFMGMEETNSDKINTLQDQVQQLNTELTTIKHQQTLNNAVTEDLSQRVGWR